MENTNEEKLEYIESGETKSEQVDSMRILNKFCWPGFIMPHFWGIGNGLLLGFLALLVPIVGVILSFTFGFGGYQMAYQKSKYDKITFYDIQAKWRKAAIIYVGVFSLIFIVFWMDGIVNYVSNKMEIGRIINDYEENEERVLKEAEILLDEKYLKMYIEDAEFTQEEELSIEDNLDLWHLKNDYDYWDLSKNLLKVEMPRIRNLGQDFALGDGRFIMMSFSVDSKYQIREIQYYMYSEDELRMTDDGPLLIIDGKRWQVYMDRETITKILQE